MSSKRVEREKKVREFLQNEVDPFVRPLLMELMKVQPANVYEYLQYWISNEGKAINERRLVDKKDDAEESVHYEDIKDSLVGVGIETQEQVKSSNLSQENVVEGEVQVEEVKETVQEESVKEVQESVKEVQESVKETEEKEEVKEESVKAESTKGESKEQLEDKEGSKKSSVKDEKSVEDKEESKKEIKTEEVKKSESELGSQVKDA